MKLTRKQKDLLLEITYGCGYDRKPVTIDTDNGRHSRADVIALENAGLICVAPGELGGTWDCVPAQKAGGAA